MVVNIKSPKALILGMMAAVLASSYLPVFADSTVIDGPGFKVEKKNGWFGTGKTTYYDALGNKYEKKKGLFGRTTTKSNVFGSETEKNGNNIIVKGPDGKPLVSKKKSWLGGEKTYVDGNGIFNSIKTIFKSP